MVNVCAGLQSKRTKKVGITGKYGTRYGASLRKIIKKMEVSQHSKFFCPFCGKVRRLACLAWDCDLLWTCLAHHRLLTPQGTATWAFLDNPYVHYVLTCLLLGCLTPLESVQTNVKRHAAGIWKCGACGKTMAGGAYVLTCALSLTHLFSHIW